MSPTVEIGHCPLCGAYICFKGDHDRDCDRFEEAEAEHSGGEG